MPLEVGFWWSPFLSGRGFRLAERFDLKRAQYFRIGRAGNNSFQRDESSWALSKCDEPQDSAVFNQNPPHPVGPEGSRTKEAPSKRSDWGISIELQQLSRDLIRFAGCDDGVLALGSMDPIRRAMKKPLVWVFAQINRLDRTTNAHQGTRMLVRWINLGSPNSLSILRLQRSVLTTG